MYAPNGCGYLNCSYNVGPRTTGRAGWFKSFVVSNAAAFAWKDSGHMIWAWNGDPPEPLKCALGGAQGNLGIAATRK